MPIVWDEIKRQTNLRKRGLDFADLEEGFDWENMLVAPTYAGVDERKRFIATSDFEGSLITIIFSPLGSEAISIITMRPASRKERRQFDGQ